MLGARCGCGCGIRVRVGGWEGFQIPQGSCRVCRWQALTVIAVAGLDERRRLVWWRGSGGGSAHGHAWWCPGASAARAGVACSGAARAGDARGGATALDATTHESAASSDARHLRTLHRPAAVSPALLAPLQAELDGAQRLIHLANAAGGYRLQLANRVESERSLMLRIQRSDALLQEDLCKGGGGVTRVAPRALVVLTESTGVTESTCSRDTSTESTK